ncbi:MAG: hypothetical protein H7Z72_26840 [Bacteroidetes bacterium]|nr:hypothetical protein [Fibrella sp.]
MKLCLLLFLPFSLLAQNNERLLEQTSELLLINQDPALAKLARSGTVEGTAEYYLKQGQNYSSRRDFEKAIVMFEKSAELDPKNHRYLGEAFLVQWYDYPRALYHLTTYDALTPTLDDFGMNSYVSYLRGLAHQKLNDHVKAIEQMSLSINSTELKYGSDWVDYTNFVNRAISYLAIQQPKEALDDLNKALKNDASSPLTQFYRGKALMALNRRVEAETAFRNALISLKAFHLEQGTHQEDEYNSICEEQIDDALAELK